MKILLFVLLIAFVCTRAEENTDNQIMSFETFTSIKDRVYSLNANYFEDLKLKIFGAHRSSWNGMINGFNNWSGYVLTDWCMGKAYQDNFIAGMMMFTFKLITLQYINVAQLVYDIYRSYLFIKAELQYCYGKEVVQAFEVFWLQTPLYLEATAIVKFLLSEQIKTLPNVFILVATLMKFDFINAFNIIGKYSKGTYDMLKTL